MIRRSVGLFVTERERELIFAALNNFCFDVADLFGQPTWTDEERERFKENQLDILFVQRDHSYDELAYMTRRLMGLPEEGLKSA